MSDELIPDEQEPETNEAPVKRGSRKNTILAKMHAILSEIGAIQKSHKNTQQNFKYRGIDDVLNTLNPLLEKHGVMMMPHTREFKEFFIGEKKHRISQITIDYHFVSVADGSTYVVPGILGEGYDSLDKGVGKAYSTALKTMVFQVFCVPTEESRDIEKDEPQPSQHQTRNQPPPPRNNAPSAPPKNTIPVPPVAEPQGLPEYSGPPKDPGDDPLPQAQWSTLRQLIAKLEIPDSEVHSFIVAQMTELGFGVPAMLSDVTKRQGKAIFDRLTAQVNAKENFLGNPTP